MSAPIKLTATANAFVSRYRAEEEGAASVLAGILAGDRSITDLHFTPLDMTSSGWIKVGIATIHAELSPPESLTAAEIQSLEHQIAELDAQYQRARKALQGRISNLQALPFNGEVIA